MKLLIIVYILFHFSSIASAEIYTWEDANGVNFSDSPSSLPVERGNESGAPGENTPPRAAAGIPEQKRAEKTHIRQSAVYKAYLDQQRSEAAALRQQQDITTPPENTGVNNDNHPSFASLIVAWMLIALFLTVIWIVTIADIVRSRFITAATKAGWLFVVMFIPLIGMLFYYILGMSQKITIDS